MSTIIITAISLICFLMLLAFANVGEGETKANVFSQFAFPTTNNTITTVTYSNTSNFNLSAIGTINSLVITVPPSEFNITNAFKVVLTGGWTLSIHKGNVTYFDANFLASPMDGTKPHIHQLTNFKADGLIPGKTNNGNGDSNRKNSVSLQTLDNNTSVSVNGTIDVKINGIDVWKYVNASISISKGNVMAIYLNDTQTDGHFGKQQVFGVVTRMVM
jgi:hypothetical protein